MKWIKDLIRKFTSQPKLTERYTLNKMYQDNTELKEFAQELMKKSSIAVVITWSDFPNDQYGKEELVQNGKVIESAKLMRGKHNLIYWQFNE